MAVSINKKVWIPVIVMMALIFIASSISGKKIPNLFPHQDIGFHSVMFAVLGFCFVRALKKTNSGLAFFARLGLTVLFCGLYGASDEWHQSFVPYRDCSLFDLAVDCTGSLIGGLLYR